MSSLRHFELETITEAAGAGTALPEPDAVLSKLESARQADRLYREQRKAYLERTVRRYSCFYTPLARALAGTATILGLALLLVLYFEFRYGWGDAPTSYWKDALRSPFFFGSAMVAQTLVAALVGDRMHRRQAALEKELAGYAVDAPVEAKEDHD